MLEASTPIKCTGPQVMSPDECSLDSQGQQMGTPSRKPEQPRLLYIYIYVYMYIYIFLLVYIYIYIYICIYIDR